MKLIPLTQITPNKEGIEGPSPYEQGIEISNDEFNQYQSQNSKVSFAPDGISNPTTTTVYSSNRQIGRFILGD